MKKYIKPQTDILTVQIERAFMIGSGVTTDGNGDVTDVDFGGDFDSGSGTIKSRGSSFWDDDEE